MVVGSSGSRPLAGPVRPEPPWPTEEDGRRAALDRLSEEIQGCRKCPLGSVRTQAVVYRGGRSPRLVFVGEAPGAAEDREGLPFVGRSGQILDAAIGSLRVAPEEIGILNVLKCRPPANQFDPAAARTCRPYLDRQLALLRPRALVSLGAQALKALDPSAPPVLTSAGVPRRALGLPLFPLVHPAASLRSGRMRSRWTADVVALAAWLDAQAF
ncbi:MAG TPA: uracil-DNA glycosylase [Thermoplasmata archaeon]|nr:uracil-DNA glycosylase [Thermoplasmata archaeon]